MAGGLSKSVSLRIVADAGTAKETLDDIVAKADEINGKRSSLTLNVHSGDTKEQLDEITAKADALGIKNVTFKVTADTASANRKIDETNTRLDLLKAKIHETAASADAGAASMGLFTTGLMGLAPAVVPIGAAGLAISAGLVPAIVSAGVGLGVFATVAKAAYTQATSGSKNLTASQKELAASVAGVKTQWASFISAAVPGVTAIMNSGIKIMPTLFKDMGEFLGPVEQALGTLTTRFREAFSSGPVQSFISRLAVLSGQSLAALGTALGDVTRGLMSLFSDIMPHTGPMLNAMDRMTASFARWAASAKASHDISAIFDYFRQTGPEVGHVLKDLADEIPKIFKAFSAWGSLSLSGIGVILDVIGKLSPGQLQAIAAGFLAIRAATILWTMATAALDVAMDLNPWVLAIGAVIAVIAVVIKYHKQLGEIASKVWHDIGSAASGVVHAITAPFSGALDWVRGHWPLIIGILTGPIGLAVEQIVTHWSQITSGIAGVFRDVGHVVTSAVSDTVNWVRDHWRVIVAWLVDPIGMTVYELRTHWTAIENGAKEMVNAVRSGIAELGHDIASAFTTAYHAALTWAEETPHAVASAWDTVRHATASAGDWLVHAIPNAFLAAYHGAVSALDALARAVPQAFNAMVHAAESWAASMGHEALAAADWFKSLPGRILGYIASLPGDMLRAGENIIEGLIHGIESAAEAIPDAMRKVAGYVTDYFTNPLKIFSPSRLFMEHGQSVVEGFALGVEQSQGRVSQVMGRMAATVAGAPMGAPPAGARGATGAVNVTVNVSGVVGDAGATGRVIAEALNAYLRQTGQRQLVGA